MSASSEPCYRCFCTSKYKIVLFGGKELFVCEACLFPTEETHHGHVQSVITLSQE